MGLAEVLTQIIVMGMGGVETGKESLPISIKRKMIFVKCCWRWKETEKWSLENGEWNELSGSGLQVGSVLNFCVDLSWRFNQ